MLRIPTGLFAGLLSGVVFFFAATFAGAGPKSLPEAAVHAHAVFLENETGFTELQYTAVLELAK